MPGQTLDYDPELDVRLAGAEKLEELALTALKDNDTALARSVLAVALSFDQAPEVPEVPPPFALSDLFNETTKATQEAPDERKPETPGS